MLSYCFKCRKNTLSKILLTEKPKKGKPMRLSKYAFYDSKKSIF